MIYALFALFAGLVALAFTRRVIPTVVNSIVFLVLSWLFMPTLAWGFWGTGFLIFLVLAAGWAWNLAFMENSEVAARTAGYGGIGLAALFLIALILVPMLTTWSAFHADTYRSLLTVEEKNFDTEQVLLDQTQARFVDQNLAKRSAEELLGNDQGLGSKVSVGTMSIQSISGRLWWVAPLEHKSIFKWWSNGTTPGYIMVSAAEYSDRRIVLNYDMRIGMGAHFGAYLPRYLYERGYATTGLTDFTFELDNEGKPFWVVTTIEPKVGFGGFVATGVVIVDPVSGKIERFSIADAPAWVDRIQPEDIVDARIDDWGEFVKGWTNSWMAGDQVLNASEGTSLVYTADGRSVWYTGMQSQGSSDEGTMGFMLVDTRTGKASFYRRAGITEAAAKKVIEGQVQEKGYKATWPIPYLVSGRPTFISVLKDEAGNSQMIGLVSYDDRTVLAVGTTLREALRSYASQLRSKGTSLAIDGHVELKTFEGTVVRIGSEQIRSETIVYITIDTVDGKVFSIPTHLSPEVILTARGDKVKVSAYETANAVIDASQFDNLGIKLEKTEDQATVDARYNEALKARDASKDRIDAQSILRDVDPETLRRLLDAVKELEKRK
jgi:hypothetical protein